MAFTPSFSSTTTCTLFLLFLNFSLLFHSLQVLAKSKHTSSLHSHSHSHSHSTSNTSSPSSHHHHPTNPRLHQAYLALHAWKKVIYSDPTNFTSNWAGPDVCRYRGVYCAPALHDPHRTPTVSTIDLNHCDIAGFLPDELGLLTDLAILHLNSNRFCGIIPTTLANLTLLYELDLSNNRFVGPFPAVVLSLPSLIYLDIRYNEFEGPLPPELFSRGLDAIFVNNNRFTSVIPANLGAATEASVVVFANNDLGGCLPEEMASLANSLEELVLINTNLSGCLPMDLGFLYKLRVLDVSFNRLVGPLPFSLSGLLHVEQLNVAHNMLDGSIGAALCTLPNLANFTASFNFFCEEDFPCHNLTSKAGVSFDDRRNCLPERPLQRSKKECGAHHAVECLDYHCSSSNHL